MQVNMKKTEGIRCGRLKTRPHSGIPELNPDLIQSMGATGEMG